MRRLAVEGALKLVGLPVVIIILGVALCWLTTDLLLDRRDIECWLMGVLEDSSPLDPELTFELCLPKVASSRNSGSFRNFPLCGLYFLRF